MTMYPPPSPPYLGPAAHTSAGDNKPIHRIVLHSTVSPCAPGGARQIAAYFRSPSAGGSAHYVVDPDEIVQVVKDSVIAWHAPPNSNSLGIEMCDMPNTTTADRWNDAAHQKMLARVATLTAQLCLAYDVPAVFLTAADLQAGKRGITTHNNVSQAFHQSTHWDPGAWPQVKFMAAVRSEIARIKAPAPKPKPKPPTDQQKANVAGRAAKAARAAGHDRWADRLRAWAKNLRNRK